MTEEEARKLLEEQEKKEKMQGREIKPATATEAEKVEEKVKEETKKDK